MGIRKSWHSFLESVWLNHPFCINVRCNLRCTISISVQFDRYMSSWKVNACLQTQRKYPLSPVKGILLCSHTIYICNHSHVIWCYANFSVIYILAWLKPKQNCLKLQHIINKNYLIYSLVVTLLPALETCNSYFQAYQRNISI